MPPLTGIGVDGTLNIPVTTQVLMLESATALKTIAQHPTPFAYWPISPDFKSINSIICTAKEIIFVLSTVGKSGTHAVDIPGLQDVIRHIPSRFAQSRHWCFVFVSDQETNLVRLRSREPPDLLRPVKSVKVYPCVFKIGSQPFPEVIDCEPSPLDFAIEAMRKMNYSSTNADLDDDVAMPSEPARSIASTVKQRVRKAGAVASGNKKRKR